MGENEFMAGLCSAARALRKAGRPESARFLLSGHPKDRYTAEALAMLNGFGRKPGVSVVLPTHLGADRIGHALESLAGQTLDRTSFEVIVVLNGPEDGTEQIVRRFRLSHPDMDVTTLRSAPAGAGRARNVGCANARFDHITFLDDDDYLSPDFLRALHERSDGATIVFSRLKDFDEDGVAPSNLVDTRLVEAFGARERVKAAEINSAGTALNMTCIKLFPAYVCDVIEFDADLRNGEDVVFWSEAHARFDLDLVLAPSERGAIYHRQVRKGSVSRMSDSFVFNVIDRAAVIRRLAEIHRRYPSPVVEQSARSAAAIAARYLQSHPGHQRQALEILSEAGAVFGIGAYARRLVSRTLAVSYCFPPWADTAGIVAAKRMRKAERVFDVISNRMEEVRTPDPTLRAIAHDLIADHVELPGSARSMSSFPAIRKFADDAKAYALRLHKTRRYEALYARVMWPASNFAAGAIKSAIPGIEWTAEFSDPIVLDIMAKPRPGKLDPAWLERSGIVAAIRQAGFPDLASDNLMEWCEYIPYALADKILFTNANQRDYMLGQPWIADLADRIMEKSVVSPHPTLPPEYYRMHRDDWRPSPSHFNVAFFGSFYKTRGLSEFLDMLTRVEAGTRDLVRLDIYTAPNPDLEEHIAQSGLAKQVRVRTALPYLQFLSRCRAYDALLVNDAATRGLKPMNPYLPSKVSDYLGAGRPIWALVEEGSPLSRVRLPPGSATSALGDPESYVGTLRELVTDWADRRARTVPPVPPSGAPVRTDRTLALQH